jgi:hypothetical protein
VEADSCNHTLKNKFNRIYKRKFTTMAILTKARLGTVTDIKLGTRTFSEVLNESKRESKSYATTSIFLSHSHDDLKDGSVDKGIVFLRQRGVRVYIDSHDTSLPPFTDADTARKIKDRIQQNKKFIFLATEKAIASKWCNWELGFGDAHKYISNIALLPIADNDRQYTGTEYLSIYPRIEETLSGSEVYNIIFPDGKRIPIADWLKS